MANVNIDINWFKVPEQTNIVLSDYDPAFTQGVKSKKKAKKQLKKNIKEMHRLQYRLYAENRQSLLIVLQAMDAGGKDSAIRHVFSGLNPQGCNVQSFKTPSANELEHGYLWRHYNKLPRKGNIGIFNRSHYENVLITRVHPEYILNENLKNIQTVEDIDDAFWKQRFEQINNFEKEIAENGTTVIKFFLNLSKDEQKNRFLKRIDNEEKNWKFAASDISERSCWDTYQQVYEEALNHTSTPHAPWFIIPADHKWYTRVVISKIVCHTLEEMNIQMPTLAQEEHYKLMQKRKELINDSASEE